MNRFDTGKKSLSMLGSQPSMRKIPLPEEDTDRASRSSTVDSLILGSAEDDLIYWDHREKSFKKTKRNVVAVSNEARARFRRAVLDLVRTIRHDASFQAPTIESSEFLCTITCIELAFE